MNAGIDAFTEPPLQDFSTQTTQTQLNPSQTTQTQTPSITTQTTQTVYHAPTSTQTQTQHAPIATQTMQTQTHVPVATQTQALQTTVTTHTTQTVQCSTNTINMGTQGPSATECAQVQTQRMPALEAVQIQKVSEVVSTPQSDTYEFLHGTRFGKLLDQLAELGFADKEKCVHVLVKHGGNMEETVDELLTA
jgi:hypothetical protein